MRFNNLSTTERLNAADSSIGGDSVERAEKASQAADSMQSIENRNFYDTEVEKIQFVQDNFKLNNNKILNMDKELKEAVIQLFIDHFDV